MKSAIGWLANSAAAVLAAGWVNAAEPAAAKSPWPLWDGKESVADYAKRAGITEVQKVLDLGDGVTMKLTLVPAGKYLRGCNPEQIAVIEGVRVVIKEADKGCQLALMWSPRSEVTITQPFYMGVSRVTLAQYGQVMGAAAAQEADRGTHYSAERYKMQVSGFGPTAPVIVWWGQAGLFCKQLSAKIGMKAWLPTEAQFEYGFPFYYEKGTADDNFASEWVHDNFTHNYFGAPTVDPAGPVCIPDRPGADHTGRGFNTGSIDADGSLKPFHGGWHGSGTPLMFRVAVAVKATATKPLEARAEKAVAVPRAKVAATGVPADPKVRVPAGCRAAAGTKAEPYTKSGWAHEIVHEATGMEMVYIPAGNFLMGITPWDESDGTDDTGRYVHGLMRQHKVTLTKGFYMGKCEVTQAQWEKVMGNNPSIFAGKVTEDEIFDKYGLVIAQHNAGPDAPVEMVSWKDCQTFCEKAGGSLRLPTEAEWEYACRAGTQGGMPDNPDEVGWYIENSGGTTHPVGLKKPNAWGLYDMQGNVWEFCQDWFGIGGSGDPVTDPPGPAQAMSYERRVVRGGGWCDYRSWFHPAVRRNAMGGCASAATGFRLVITAAGTP